MKIICLFGQRRDPEIIELMVAWDEYCVDANVEGFDEACDAAKRSWRDDLLESRVVEIEVDEDAIRARFEPVRMTGRVVEDE